MDWDEMARPWLEAAPDLETSFSEVFDALFQAANLKSGEAVLDVGCGTGPTLVYAAKEVGPEGSVVGIDVAPPLVAVAQKRAPKNVELIVGDAGTHGYEQGSFDAIVANFGIMFFNDNTAAFENLRSAMKPRGRMAATFWATPPENPWFSMPRRIVDSFVDDVPRPDPSGPGPMRFGDPASLETIMENSGWKPKFRTLDLMLRPPGSAERVADLHMKVTVGMMLKGVEVSEQKLSEIRMAVADACQQYQCEEGIAVPAKIHVVEAVAV
ncbi:MAG: class I SAM-dependent methyltransferase [Sedimentitalea sp.]|uniref:class I SAM-dependent methyltransferase n=1 Tax=Sedimentitalea sp. TaxID=2048915 RepID=UPI003265ED98